MGAAPAERTSEVRHPVITEVLYNVPPGEGGDANKDGSRDAAGDEFIELFNPHGKAIQLKGYTITSRLSTGDPAGQRGVRFTFPSFELPPGGVVVVFNGYKSRPPGPSGTEDRAPSGVNKNFGDGYVFTMGTKQPMNAWKNDGDFALLTAPDGTALEAVVWGSPDPKPPEKVGKVENADVTTRGSVQRETGEGAFVPHAEIDNKAFSPGEMPAAKR